MRPEPSAASRRASHLFTALLIVLAGLRSAPARAASSDPDEAPVAVATSAALARALDAVQTADICADVHFIASDELEGRDTPSRGLRIAARYIRARLERLGFEPGAQEGYFHHYPLERAGIDEHASRVRVESAQGGIDLRLGKDYHLRFARLWDDLTLSGRVVYCGSGSREELDAANPAGAWALVLDSGKGRSRAIGPLRGAEALGVIHVPAADFEGPTYAEQYGPELARALEGSYRFPRSEGRRPAMRQFAQLYLAREAGELLLARMPGYSRGEDGAEQLPAPGTWMDGSLTDERRLGLAGGELLVENVCGFWRGSDPELSQEVILVSAHYDHIGVRGGEINNGADDNGSGTTGLLALAEALQARGPLRRSVLLIWVSGEEKGLWGSRAWASEPWLPEGCRPVANLNIDMIGRNAPETLYVTPTEAHEQHNFIVRLARQLAPLEGFPELGDADEFYGRSDQASFATLGIPVAFLFSGVHEDYHRPSDTPDKIDCDKVRRVTRLVVRLLDALQGDSLGD